MSILDPTKFRGQLGDLFGNQMGGSGTTGPYNPTSGVLNSEGLPSDRDWRTMNANVNVNAAPPGSAIEQYYQRMMQLMPTQRQQGLADVGSLLGSFAGDQRTNRAIQGNALQGLDSLMLDREANQNRVGLDAQSEFDKLKLASAVDKRASTGDAMQKIQLGAHLQRGDRVTDPRTGAVSYTPRSDQERAAATGLIDQMHSQLNRSEYEPTKFTPDRSYTPSDPNKYANPGIMERMGQYGSLATGALGLMDKFGSGGSNGAGGFLSKLLGNSGGATGIAGKALPMAGAVTGGLGLMKNQGLGSNIMNGVSTGASIGSIVPGLGTAVGAGVGGLIGGLRSLFGRKPKPQGPVQSGPGQYRVN